MNKLIYDHCSQEVFVGIKTSEDAAYSAVVQFNDGKISILKHFEHIDIAPGRFTSHDVVEANVKRIYWSEWKSTEKAKKRRKHLHALKKGFEDKKEEESNMYESGAH